MAVATAAPVPAARSRRAARRLALLGGTTSTGDALAALRLLARPGRLVAGEAIARYERAFAAHAGVPYAFSFSHGRVGLYGLLQAFGIGAGDEVLMQAPTHIVVPNAVHYLGARAVYVDCQPDTLNMDMERAARAVTGRTRALVLQHTFGAPADIDGARALCRQHGLVLIEDCVHALGSRYRGRPAGSFGDAAFFSTEETKTISTTMGGVAVTADATIAGRLAAFQRRCDTPPAGLVARYAIKLAAYHVLTEPRLHRLTRPLYEMAGRRNPLPGPTAPEELHGRRPRGYERRFSHAQAVLGLRQLDRLDANIAHRRRIAAIYRAELGRLGVPTPQAPEGSDPVLVRYPVWVTDRAAAVRALRPLAVAGQWFTSVLEEAVNPQAGGYRAGSCPVAEHAATALINLPTHQRVRADDARLLLQAIVPWVAGAAPPGRDRL